MITVVTWSHAIPMAPLRLQSMKDNNLINDGGDWLTRKEVAKEKLSPDFTNQQIQAKLAEVSPQKSSR